MNRSQCALIGALTLALAGAASAQDDPNYGPQHIEVRVDTSDLDLATEAGSEALVRRLTSAARDACGGRPDWGVHMLAQRQAYGVCVSGAVDTALAQVEARLSNRQLAGADPRPRSRRPQR